MEAVSMQNGKIQLNRIEPVDDKEVNKSLFEMYANITYPLRFVEGKIDKAEELRRQGHLVRTQKFNSVVLFIGLSVICGLLTFLGTMIYCSTISNKVREKLGTEVDDETLHRVFQETHPVAYQLMYSDALFYWLGGAVVCALLLVVFRYCYKKRKKENLLRAMESEYNQLQEKIRQAVKVLEPYLEYVPPAYRNSYALQHFVDSYMNLRVNNVSEAVKEYDAYIHRKNMVQGLRNISAQLNCISYIQKQSLTAQRATLAQLNIMQGWMIIDTLFS